MYSKIFLIAGLLSLILASLFRANDAYALGWVLAGIGIGMACISYLVNESSIRRRKEIRNLKEELELAELRNRKKALEEERGM